jgi:hypothetical protein
MRGPDLPARPPSDSVMPLCDNSSKQLSGGVCVPGEEQLVVDHSSTRGSGCGVSLRCELTTHCIRSINATCLRIDTRCTRRHGQQGFRRSSQSSRRPTTWMSTTTKVRRRRLREHSQIGAWLRLCWSAACYLPSSPSLNADDIIGPLV